MPRGGGLCRRRLGAHGAGPTWTELGEELGWSPALRARIIRLLAREGVLTYSTEPRSLAATEEASRAGDL